MQALFNREFIRLSRQKGRLFGAFLTPLMIWFFLGLGFEHSFVLNGNNSINYFEYFFPGIVLMTLLFSAIFSMISLIEDRESGFLQSVLVSPLNSGYIVLAKILSCTMFAFVQCIILLLCAYTFKLNYTFFNGLEIISVVFLASFLMSSIGFLLAWVSNSMQTFHVWMNIILMPMWLFSGALFSFDQVPAWMKLIFALNPLSYALSAMRRTLSVNVEFNIPSLCMSNICMIILSLIFFIISMLLLEKKRKV